MVLIASEFLFWNSCLQRSSREQRSPDAGAICVPRRVMTTVEYIKMRVLATMTSGGRAVSPFCSPRRRSRRLFRSYPLSSRRPATIGRAVAKPERTSDMGIENLLAREEAYLTAVSIEFAEEKVTLTQPMLW
jgi:hypothetical protein